jgi:hypothetical protein
MSKQSLGFEKVSRIGFKGPEISLQRCNPSFAAGNTINLIFYLLGCFLNICKAVMHVLSIGDTKTV